MLVSISGTRPESSVSNNASFGLMKKKPTLNHFQYLAFSSSFFVYVNFLFVWILHWILRFNVNVFSHIFFIVLVHSGWISEIKRILSSVDKTSPKGFFAPYHDIIKWNKLIRNKEGWEDIIGLTLLTHAHLKWNPPIHLEIWLETSKKRRKWNFVFYLKLMRITRSNQYRWNRMNSINRTKHTWKTESRNNIFVAIFQSGMKQTSKP